MNIVSENLKRFRLEKNMTQEDLAGILHVNAQTVSRWECGTTMPDIMLLPQIAQNFGVTVDDLYKKSSIAYQNYAQRLASVYELTRRPEDFFLAYTEFQKRIKANEMSAADKYNFAFLFDAMLFYCKDKALEWYDKAIAEGPAHDPHSYSRSRSLKANLLMEFGQGDAMIAEQKERLKTKNDAWEWSHLIELYELTEQYEEAYACFTKAVAFYPNDWHLQFRGAETCSFLGRCEEALQLYQKAGELGTDFHDEIEGMAWVYEKMGDHEKELAALQKLHDLYMQEGYEYEAEIYTERMEELQKILNK